MFDVAGAVKKPILPDLKSLGYVSDPDRTFAIACSFFRCTDIAVLVTVKSSAG